ncbi:MAG TPA: Ig-like domain-containing protein, partial [Mycobacteriales bacterium]|nr:Ig-like domain-containing protein [Mycobacteriales bacterium]
PQKLTATVRDSAGHVGTATRNVTVRNGAPATLTAAFTKPADGATVTGNVTIGMSESGANGTPITFVLSVDSTQIFTAAGTATSASYSWNSASVANGAHTLNLTVRDGAGRTATAARSVTVTNMEPPPPPGTLKVFITSPADGAAVNGTVWSDIWVEGAAAGTNTFTLSIGGTTLASATGGNHVTLPWDSTRVTNGTQTLTATVRDASSNSGAATRAFNVQNAGGGTSPLVASFTSPADGATVSGTVGVGMSETGASGTPITFTLRIDGTQVSTTSGTATTATYSWNTATASEGSHTLSLTVGDGAGRTSTATRTVTVSNGTPPPPPPGAVAVFITAPSEGATVSATAWFTVWIENAAAGSKTYTLS